MATLGNVTSSGLGAIAKSFQLVDEILGNGVLINGLGTQKLLSVERTSAIRNTIEEAKVMAELQAEAKTLGITIPVD